VNPVSTIIPKIILPELFSAFVAPIGSDVLGPLKAFKAFFESNNYTVVDIKVTDIFPFMESYVPPKIQLRRSPAYERYTTYIKYGDQLREHFSDDAVLAVSSIGLIARKRAKSKNDEPFTKTVYLIYQFKRKEEIDLLRSVYGRLIFQYQYIRGVELESTPYPVLFHILSSYSTHKTIETRLKRLFR
jgi:hypothetical protein